MSTSTSTMPSVFRTCLKGDKIGFLGAPVFNLALFFDPFHARVSGMVDISQSVTLTGGEHRVHVSGSYHPLIGGLGYIVSLTGQFSVPFPPPAIGQTNEQLYATLILDEHWNGKGNFHWGKMIDLDVPITSVPC